MRFAKAALQSSPIVGALLLGVLTSISCYQGLPPEDEREVAAGEIGSVCNNGACSEGVCFNNEVCINPADPCEGFTCGGHGTCFVNLDTEPQSPVCMCDGGYSNTQYALLCNDMFVCGDGSEVPFIAECNGTLECADGLDEANCG